MCIISTCSFWKTHLVFHHALSARTQATSAGPAPDDDDGDGAEWSKCVQHPMPTIMNSKEYDRATVVIIAPAHGQLESPFFL